MGNPNAPKLSNCIIVITATIRFQSALLFGFSVNLNGQKKSNLSDLRNKGFVINVKCLRPTHVDTPHIRVKMPQRENGIMVGNYCFLHAHNTLTKTSIPTRWIRSRKAYRLLWLVGGHDMKFWSSPEEMHTKVWTVSQPSHFSHSVFIRLCRLFS